MTDEGEKLPGAQETADKPAGPRMPLTAQRLTLIGGVCVFAGLVAGRFLFAGLLLAATGMVCLAVALSYRAGKVWFSPLSWLVSIAGSLWVAATAGYGWAVGAFSESPSGPDASAPLLSYLGVGGLVVMISGLLAAWTLRMVQTRRKNMPSR